MPKQATLSRFDKIDTLLAEVLWACTETDILLKYDWVISHWDIDVVQELGLVEIIKYQRRILQVAS